MIGADRGFIDIDDELHLLLGTAASEMLDA